MGADAPDIQSHVPDGLVKGVIVGGDVVGHLGVLSRQGAVVLNGMGGVELVEAEADGIAGDTEELGAQIDGVCSAGVGGVKAHAEGVEETLLHGLLRDVAAVAVDETVVGHGVQAGAGGTVWWMEREHVREGSGDGDEGEAVPSVGPGACQTPRARSWRLSMRDKVREG